MFDKIIISKSISLLEAIKVNDINNVKLLVEDLNNNFIPSGQIISLDEIIPLQAIYNDKPDDVNESFLYVVNNLKNVNQAPQLKWYIKAIFALRNKDINVIVKIITDSLANGIENFQIGLLIQMCVTIDRYDLLAEIRKYIKTTEEE